MRLGLQAEITSLTLESRASSQTAAVVWWSFSSLLQRLKGQSVKHKLPLCFSHADCEAVSEVQFGLISSFQFYSFMQPQDFSYFLVICLSASRCYRIWMINSTHVITKGIKISLIWLWVARWNLKQFKKTIWEGVKSKSSSFHMYSKQTYITTLKVQSVN